jgi:hypothetical protein
LDGRSQGRAGEDQGQGCLIDINIIDV